MDRYEVMAGKMKPLTDGAHRKWGFTGKVETRSYERLVDALIDFVETGDGLKARFAIYVVILLSGLLVFWSAIFIDSKGRKFSRQEDSRILRKHHREIGKTMAINRVTIMGNLTRDAELRKKGDATSVLTFGLAINEKKKDNETGEYVDAPVFVDCALFGARAEALAPYLTKGKKVSVDGRLRYHSWMKNDEKRHALSVLVTDIEFADSKGAGKDTVSAQGQSTEPETYDADIPF